MISIAWIIPVKTIHIKNSYILTLITQLYNNLSDTYNNNFYLGFDFIPKDIHLLQKFKKETFHIHTIKFKNIKSGHLTKMWNTLFKISYPHNDYFFQCGDDIEFPNYNFLDQFVTVLQKHNNIGITGYYQKNNINLPLLTQTFVSKIHMNIFGVYFPEQIKNWFCDNWINTIYKNCNRFFPIPHHTLTNKQTVTGARYTIPKNIQTIQNIQHKCQKLILLGSKYLHNYIKTHDKI